MPEYAEARGMLMNMGLLVDSFWRAAAYCLRPRVIMLSLAPLLLIGVLAVPGAIFTGMAL